MGREAEASVAGGESSALAAVAAEGEGKRTLSVMLPSSRSPSLSESAAASSTTSASPSLISPSVMLPLIEAGGVPPREETGSEEATRAATAGTGGGEVGGERLEEASRVAEDMVRRVRVGEREGNAGGGEAWATSCECSSISEETFVGDRLTTGAIGVL